MKIRLKTEITGLRNGVPWPAVGETMELPDNEAAEMCAAGHGEPVAEKAQDKAEKRPAAKRGETRKA